MFSTRAVSSLFVALIHRLRRHVGIGIANPAQNLPGGLAEIPSRAPCQYSEAEKDLCHADLEEIHVRGHLCHLISIPQGSNTDRRP